MKYSYPLGDFNDDDFIYKGKQSIAHRRVRQMLVNGTIKRPDACQVCGKQGNVVAHHYLGYDYPFQIWWVCRKCNSNLPDDGSLSNYDEARLWLKNRERTRVFNRMEWLTKWGQWIYTEGKDILNDPKRPIRCTICEREIHEFICWKLIVREGCYWIDPEMWLLCTACDDALGWR